MTRQRMGVSVVIGLVLTIAVAVLLARCPWSACRYVNLNTYTIRTLQEYREFLSNEGAFKSHHRVVAVMLHCSALRDDVVTALQNGQLMLGPGKQDMANLPRLHAWHQGLVFHLANAMSGNEREQETWAAMVQETVANQEHDQLAFLPRLFGGLILHVHNKQKPMVLFSDERCV